MEDRELYRQILGIKEPWEIDCVDLLTAENAVHVYLKNPEKRLPCPKCRYLCRRYDSRERRWRHLDTCQFQTILIADTPRVECEKHGVLQVEVPWAEPGSRFTAMFEALVISWLQEASLSAVARLLGVGWKVVDGIQRRAVERGLKRRKKRLPQHLGVDETSFQKRHEYVTVVLDRKRNTVLHVADDRDKEALDSFFEQFTPRQLAQVESVAMDMWRAYISSVEEYVPEAEKKIVFDKFHIAQHLGNAVDKVRRQEHRQLRKDGDDTLKGSRYLWLMNPERMSTNNTRELAALRAISLKTARAWAIKEFAMTLWSYQRRGWARRAWLRWYSWAIRSRLEPVKNVARMIKRHLEGVLNAVTTGITNARSEAINAGIQRIKKNACGFRNRDRFRTAIYFHLGGLDLYPRLTHTI